MSIECGIAVFVKTPEFSPVKTRLAAQIGKASAIEFYEIACAVIETNLQIVYQENTDIIPYWAVAEGGGMVSERWRNFPRVFQGHGDLGERLHMVYSTLLAKHGAAVLIGADSPQISSYDLVEAVSILQNAREEQEPISIIGRANDGGFYLFGSSIDFPKAFWTDVVYSMPSTSEELSGVALDFGKVIQLSEEVDVDTLEDLIELSLTFPERCEKSLAHSSMQRWLTTFSF